MSEWDACGAPTPGAQSRYRAGAIAGRPLLLLRRVCAALLAWIGYVHLHLWLEGYRQIPTDGPLFLLGALAGFALGFVLLAWPRPLAGLLAAGDVASTLGALIISLSVGLFGFRESMTSASFVTDSLTIETIAVLVLMGLDSRGGGHAAACSLRRGIAPQRRDRDSHLPD